MRRRGTGGPGGDSWTLIDLRPIRNLVVGKKVTVDDTMRRLIFGFDAVVIVPEVHPATLVE